MDFPKSVPGVGLVDGKFADEDAALGRQGSLIPAAWGNAVTGELLNVIEAAGLEPDEEQADQVLTAIHTLIANALPQTQGLELPEMRKTYTGPCFSKEGADALSVRPGTSVYIPGHGHVHFTEVQAIEMPSTLIAGEDYAVFVSPDATLRAVPDPVFSPASPPTPGAIKIGGFHYGLITPSATVASGSFATTGPGMRWTQADVDQIAGINAWSIWDLQWRPKCDPRGMTCVRSDAGLPIVWVDIYFCGTNHIVNGTSRHNTDVASGTVLPRIPLMFGGNGTNTYSKLAWFEAQEIALSHGKRLMSYQEFAAAAFGTTENQSLGGAASTIPATGRTAGYTSKWGLEQSTGHHWTYGDVAHADSGTAWVTGADRGQTYGTPVRAIFGGSRDNAADSGSRCSHWSRSAWYSSWADGWRAACDPLSL